MKNILKVFASLIGALALSIPVGFLAQTTVTPNIGLQIPGYNQANRQVPINYDLQRLDLFLSGNLQLPALNVGTLTTGSWTVTSPWPISAGGTGTTSPGSIPGLNINISGSWPNETFSVVNSPTFTGVTSGSYAFTSGPTDTTGAGAPITGCSSSTYGSTYRDTSGTAGASLYVCDSTGWKSLGTAASTQSMLISGGGVFFTGATNYTYTVAAASYDIAGTSYTSAQTNETLATPDPTNNRFDTFYVDDSGSVGVITGTASANPVIPQVDPATQLYLTSVEVYAGTTTPTGTTNENVYLENAEWTCSGSASVNCASTNNPFAGTYDVETTAMAKGDYVNFAKGSTFDATNASSLGFEIRSKATWNSQRSIVIATYDGSTVTGSVTIKDGTYSLNTSNTSSYQIIVIPWSAFGMTDYNVTSIRGTVSGGGSSTIGFYLDNVIIQSGSTSGGIGGGSSVMSVGMLGDGTVFKQVVPGSPVTGAGTLQPQLQNVPSGEVLAGPIANLGSNVGVRQLVACGSYNTGTYDCPPFSTAAGKNPVIKGDKLIVPLLATSTTVTVSDDLGTIFSYVSIGGYGGSGRVAIGTLTASGDDTVHIIGANWFSNGGGTHYLAYALEMTGTNTIEGGFGWFGGSGTGFTTNVTPTAATDVIMNLGMFWNGGDVNLTGLSSWNPSGTTLDKNTSQGGNQGGFGTLMMYAPGSTSATTNVFSVTCYTGCSYGGNTSGFSLDISQDASAGSAPWGARKLTEGDLPASAVNALQSVTRFLMTSTVALPPDTDTTVLSGAVTMPTDGCPCRVNVQAGIIVSSTTSANWGWWASDGTHTFGDNTSVTTDLHTPPIVIGSISPYSYSNSQTVTFSIHINPAGYTATGNTVQALATLNPPLLSGDSSWMMITVEQSRN